jgi:gamma-glutamyl phosphate reductase
LYGGPQALKYGIVDHAANGLSVEYGDLRCCAARQQPFDMNMRAALQLVTLARMTVEIMKSAEEAIAHINQHGSHHTDCIVTKSHDTALLFTQGVDSACTFINASSPPPKGFK